LPGRIDQQDSRRRLDAHRAVAQIVLGDSIPFRGDLQTITRHSGTIDHVAEGQLRRARLKGARHPRDLDAVATQDCVAVDRAIRAHPGGELKRLALIDHGRRVERFDGDVRRLATAEGTEIDRQPARRRLVRCRRHRRAVGLAVGEHNQSAGAPARNHAGGQADCAPQIAAVALHLLYERAGLAKGLGQPLDSRLASICDDPDAIARRPALLEQPDDLQRTRAAVGGHRKGEIGDHHDVDPFTAHRRQGHTRDQRQDHEHHDAYEPAERGGSAAPEVHEQQRHDQQQQLGKEQGERTHL
jgi:hypothetical protein